MKEQTFEGKPVAVESKIDRAARLAAAIFAFQEWEYGLRPAARIPGRAELAETIKYLLKMATKGSDRVGSGRFKVVWNEDFARWEISLILTDLTSRELYKETGIDKKVTGHGC